MIKFDNNIFYLQTRNTTYSFGVLDNRLLLHLYWGKRIYFVPKNVMDNYYKRNLMAFDCGKYSSDGLPLEYSTFGSADLRLPTFGAVYSDGSRITKLLYKDYNITNGKPQIKGLPSTYCEENDTVLGQEGKDI